MDAEALLAECEPLVRQMAYTWARRGNRLSFEQDLAQEARIGLWRECERAPADDMNRVKWAATVIRTRLIDALRSEKGCMGYARASAQVVPLDDAPEMSRPCEAVSLLAVTRLLDAIKSLPPRRRAFIEGLAEGREQQDIAAELGVGGVTAWQERKWLQAWVRKRL